MPTQQPLRLWGALWVGPTPRARSPSSETSLRVNLELHLAIAGGP